MFDIGFAELLLISMVALLVLGPDKLPHAVRTAALWIGRARRSFNKVRGEIEQQLNTDEIRRQLHNESILKDLEDAKKKAGKLTEETRASINSMKDEIDEIGDIGGGVTRKGNEKKKAKDEDKESKAGTKQDSADAKPAQPATLPDSQAETGGTAIDSKDDPLKPKSGATPAESEPAESGPEESGPEENEPQAPRKPPVEDFYNNPSQKVVTIKQGQMTAPPEPPDADQDASSHTRSEPDSKTDRKSDTPDSGKDKDSGQDNNDRS